MIQVSSSPSPTTRPPKPDFIVGAESIYSKVHPHIVKSELDYSGFMAITGTNIDKHTLREYAPGVHSGNPLS
jgi:hypothetical protein